MKHDANSAILPRFLNVQTLKLALLAGLICFLAVAAIEITRGGGRIAAVWPVNAVLLCAVLTHRHRRNWKFILLAGAAGLFTANLIAGAPPGRALYFTLANAAEVLLIASIVTFRRKARLISTRGISIFFVAVILGCIASSGLAALFLTLSGSPLAWSDLLLLYAANVLGMLLFAPVIWSLLNRSRKFQFVAIDTRMVLSFALVVAVTLAIFLQSEFPLLFLVPAALVAMAFVTGIKGAAIGLLAVAAISFPLTYAGLGPTALMETGLTSREIVLQAFLAANSIMALAAGAAVSDRRRLLQRLNRSQTRLRNNMDHMRELLGQARLAETMSGVGHWALTPATNAVFWSPEVYAIHGVDPSEFDPGYDDAIAFYVAEDRDRVRELVASGIASGQSWDFEATIERRSDGALRRVQSFGECVCGPDGTVEKVIGVFRDITDQTKLMKDLAEREYQYRMLAEFSTDIVVQFGLDGKIIYASPSCSILGVTQEQAIGKSTVDFVVADDREYAAEVTQDLFLGDDPDRSVRREYRVRTVDGDLVWLEGNPTLIRDEAGEPSYVVSTFRNVTDRRAREEALALARVEAESATKAKADFLSSMSHEIRTPLNGILGFTQLLSRTDLNPDQENYLNRVTQAGQMLRHIVDDVLDYSKIEAGQMLLAPSRFELNDVIRDVCELAKVARPKPGVVLNVELETADTLSVNCDETRLRQILINLIGNGLKFTERGHVTIRATRDGDDISITVSDTGPGISADKQDMIFDKFQQADTTIARKYGGTGLGLAISRSLAELMGGQLDLESEAGVGTQVTLYLPEAVSTGQAGASLLQQPAAAPACEARLMVVDDVELNLDLIKLGLEAFGHTVTTFSSAPEAIENLAAGGAYDLVLMDIQMPDMDGLTALRKIRATMPERNELPVYALTAQALPAQIREIRRAGFDAYVSKPVDIEELHELICKQMSPASSADMVSPPPADTRLHTEFQRYKQSMRDEFAAFLHLSSSADCAEAMGKLAMAMAAAADALGLTEETSEARAFAEAIEASASQPEHEQLQDLINAYYASGSRLMS